MATTPRNSTTPAGSPPTSPLTPTPAWVENGSLELLVLAADILGKRAAEEDDNIDPILKRARHDELVLPAATTVATQAPTTQVTSAQATSVSGHRDKKDSAGSTPISVSEVLSMDAQYIPPKRDPGDLDSVDPRPSPPLKPEVYSHFRQALCEALPYYEAYQGSCYSTDLKARGYLIDKECEIRDYLGSQVIISTW